MSSSLIRFEKICNSGADHLGSTTFYFPCGEGSSVFVSLAKIDLLLVTHFLTQDYISIHWIRRASVLGADQRGTESCRHRGGLSHRGRGGFVPGAIRFLRSESALTHWHTVHTCTLAHLLTGTQCVSQWCHHISCWYFSSHLPILAQQPSWIKTNKQKKLNRQSW